MKYLLTIIWLMTCSICVQAQQKLVKELAEPFTIQCKLMAKKAIPEKGSTSGVFELLDVQAQKTDSQLITLQLIAYDTGTFKLSDIIIDADPKQEIIISISAPPESLVKEYAPVKEIDIAFEEPTNYKNYLYLLLAIAGIALVLYLIVRKKKAKPENLIMPDDERWEDKLFRISDGWKNEKLNSVELGEGLVSVLHSRFRVPQKKSIRKLYKAIQKETPALNGNGLKEILAQTDAWRFGKQQAEQSSGTRAIEIIKQIAETKENIKTI